MRFQVIASLLALGSPMAALAAPQAVNATIVNTLSAAVGTLRSTILPFHTSINHTIAGLGLNPTAAQKNAAIQSATHDLQGMTTALQVAIVALSPVSALHVRDSPSALDTRQNVGQGLTDLVEFVIGDFIYGVADIIQAFGSGDFENVLIALGAPFDYLFGYIISGQLVDSGLLYSKPDYEASIKKFDALIPQK